VCLLPTFIVSSSRWCVTPLLIVVREDLSLSLLISDHVLVTLYHMMNKHVTWCEWSSNTVNPFLIVTPSPHMYITAPHPASQLHHHHPPTITITQCLIKVYTAILILSSPTISITILFFFFLSPLLFRTATLFS